MSVPVSNPQSALRACITKAVHGGEALMAQWLATASQSLSAQTANPATSDQERPELVTALELLQAHGPALRQAYPLALLNCFSQDSNPAEPPPVSKSADIHFAELSLVDEKEHDVQLNLVQAQQQATHATEAVLSELNTLVSAAQGLRYVQAESNPLRPASYIRALQQVLAETDIPAPLRQRWMQLMLPALGPALVNVYRDAIAYLRQQGVAPANYGLASSRHGTSPESGSSRPTSAWQAATDMDAQAEEAALTASILHQLLQGGSDPYSDMAPVWEQESLYGQAIATDPAAQAAAVVAQMMNNMAQDARLLPAVRQSLQEMTPAIGQMASQDPQFFNDPAHPARRLLDEVTQRSLAFGSEQAPGFADFIYLLRQAVQHLARQNTPLAASFEQVLLALKKAWQALQDREKKVQAQANPARSAEPIDRYQHLTREVASNIRHLPDTAHVPANIMQFATGPWAQAIAQAQLENPQSSDGDPHGYLALVPLLFWSVRPGMNASERKQMAQAMPDMFSSLQQGLRHMGQAEAEISQFMALLRNLHQQTLCITTPSPPHSANPPVPPPTNAQRSSQPEHPAQASPDIDIELEYEDPTVELPAAASTTATTTTEPPRPSNHAFPLGTWIELRGNRGLVRTQLTWASPQDTLFLFTAADGSTQSMTRRTRDRLLAEGSLHIAPPP